MFGLSLTLEKIPGYNRSWGENGPSSIPYRQIDVNESSSVFIPKAELKYPLFRLFFSKALSLCNWTGCQRDEKIGENQTHPSPRTLSKRKLAEVSDG